MTGRALLLVGALGAWVCVPVGAAAPAVAGAPGCEATSAGSVGVVVVVDLGDLPEASGEPSIACVALAEGGTGTDVLAARASMLGTPPPRYDDSGLLCSIDGLPRDGCGERVEGGYAYWSYWLGTSEGWEHATVGPAFREAEASTTEGWHFVRGAGRPSDPPPGAPSDPRIAAEEATAGVVTAGSGGSDAGIAGAVAGGAAVLLLAVVGVVVARRRRSP